MRTADFDYTLPDELIAQAPIEPRDAARLLLLDRASGALGHHHVRDLPHLLRPGDLLVLNRSRVLPARVRGTLKGGGRGEALLLRRLAAGRWQALVRPARRLRPGDALLISAGLCLRVLEAQPEGLRELGVESDAADPDAALLAAGSVPLPPYIRSWVGDPERYQTVFGDVEGSAAAPTAGLHLTQALLDRLREHGVSIGSLVLHVGLDTFRPITHADPTQHTMHREWYELPEALQAQVQRTRADGGRVVAVGTTCVRALETWASTGQTQGWTSLFIRPGHVFGAVDGLMTNFHLPRSTLLMLVSALVGRERLLATYQAAIAAGYRFYSFGDAMLIV